MTAKNKKAESGSCKHDSKTKKTAAPVAGDTSANADDSGYCFMVEDAEMSRPDSGDPCDEGHAG